MDKILKKEGQATPQSISQVASQNNNPIAIPQPPVVNNAEIKNHQPTSPVPPPPEGNSQGQKIPPQKSKGKFMNRNNLDVKKNAS